MAVYDREEQESIDDLKAWWSRWGNTVSWVAITAAVVVVGSQAWRWYSAGQSDAAGALYFAVASAARTNEPAKAREAMTALADKHAGSAFAPRGALIYAKLLWDAGDKAGARAQFQWVIDRSSDDDLKAIARYRLAEVHLDEKQVDEALKLLDTKHPDAYAGLYADLRGDALTSAGKLPEARTAYETALAKLDPKSGYRNYVQVKLEAIGGRAPAPAAATPVAGGATAPASAAPAAPGTAAPAPAKP